ncbi:MAG TPA: cytochrome o ubiquinol oxidase subunit IV [Caulobacteraceae bacterium]|jgi:cytochrome o ubiquinol oxidase operon protein cyoD|nr:cytochrome o ubiquinol oxidase subunit IV [Caulobacteraceae bacterium]
MTQTLDPERTQGEDTAPGDERLDGSGVMHGVRGYLVGLLLAAGLTAASFYLAQSHLIWPGGVAAALTALALGQMGVHLVFFLHLTSGPDNTNNALALAFGVLIVGLIIGGTILIMYVMDQNMMGHAMAQMPA